MKAVQRAFSSKARLIHVGKQLRSVKSLSVAVLLIMLTVVGTYAMHTYTFSNVGEISFNVMAKSGSSEDIQEAVDAVVVVGGRTVYVPEGDFAFFIDSNKIAQNNVPAGVIIPGGVNVIGMGKSKTILRQANTVEGFLFAVNGGNGESVRISGISFIGYNFTEEGNPLTLGICIMGATDFRIDHCDFQDFSGKAIECANHWVKGVNRGVIDHCDFDNPYMDNPDVTGPGGGEKVWPYGVQVGGSGREDCWQQIDYYLGQYNDKNNIVYIEDCTFKRCRHAGVGSTVGGGFYVLRYCNISMPRYAGMTDVHGSYAPSPYVGGRGIEAYNNRFDWNAWKSWGGQYAFLLRGGGGAIYNNTIKNCTDGAICLIREGPNPICYIKDLWVWDNTLILTPNLISNPGNFTEGVDYFLYAKPGYTPYLYPHPLTLEATP